MKALELDPLQRDLLAMRALLSEPERWTKGATARSRFGWEVNPLSHDAVQWCLVGAARRVTGNTVPVVKVLMKHVEGSLTSWNDAPSRTHADVLALLDRAL